MKALAKTAPGVGNVELIEVPEPVPGPGQVVVEVKAAGICGTDLHIWMDEFKTKPPVVMGHEFSGRVHAIGEGVENFQPGDRVTSETYFETCGECIFCRRGRANLCPERRSIGSAVNGAFAKYVLVPAVNLHRLPKNVDYEAGALTEPLACVVHAVLEETKIVPGDLVLVSGPGPIGLLTLAVVKASGARTVVLGLKSDARRLEAAKKMGADYVIAVDEEDALAKIAELSGGYGADVALECAGAGPSAATCLAGVRRAGQYTQIGLFGRPIQWEMDQVCYKELKVTGTNASVPSAWDKALELMAQGLVDTKTIVSDVLPFADWEKGFKLAREKDSLKVLLTPSE